MARTLGGRAGDGDNGDDGDDGDDDDGRTFPAHPGPIPKACREQMSRKGTPHSNFVSFPRSNSLKNKWLAECQSMHSLGCGQP